MKSVKKRMSYDYILVTAGVIIMSCALELFLVPNKITTGGVTTIATVFLYKFNIPLSVTNIVINAGLFIIAYKFLTRRTLIKTVYGVVSFSLFLEIASFLPSITNNLLIASVSGGVLIGTGVGIVIRYGASTGGSDLSALLFNKLLPHISVSRLLMTVDIVIILLSYFVFRSYEIAFYSLLCIFILAKVADNVITMGKHAKAVYILSEKATKISEYILSTLNRGVTGIYCKGMYSSDKKTMLMCIASVKELPHITRIVREIDASAFLILTDVRDVFGKGFSE